MNRIGIIGLGNMGTAIASGMAAGTLIEAKEIFAYDTAQEALQRKAGEIGITACGALDGMLEQVDTVLVAIKPYQIEAVLGAAREQLAGKTIVSIAAGWSLEKYRQLLGEAAAVQYIMPNTPAMVGAGMFMFEEAHSLTEEDHETLLAIFSEMGEVAEVPSHLMDIGMAISGCGPAYIDLVIEALGDAGVKYGLQRPLAYKLASQMILGTAKLQLETGLHPGVLKDNVCSPAGTTIRGVDALEHAGLRAAFLDAVDAIMDMTKEG